jgi:hypothetical protein
MVAMNAILYPIGRSADEALQAALGYAARESDAQQAIGGPVVFVSEAIGPAFVTEAAAADAYRAKGLAAGGWWTLRPVVEGRAAPPKKPVYKDGRRWPEPATPPSPTLWRLSISYWRPATEAEGRVPHDAARRVRRDPNAQALDPRALQALAHQPLRPVAPQRPLDMGLFEVRLPEAPDRVVPDE